MVAVLFVVMESVFYFDQINDAGIFNVRIAASDLFYFAKCCLVYSGVIKSKSPKPFTGTSRETTKFVMG